MKEIKFNIIGFKNFDDDYLSVLKVKIDEAVYKLGYNEIADTLRNLSYSIERELNKRQRSNCVWVEFVAVWSGYSQPASQGQRREVGRFYRKVNRTIFDKLPKFYQHNFSDGTTNDWSIRQVSVKGKDSGSYGDQVNEIINSTF